MDRPKRKVNLKKLQLPRKQKSAAGSTNKNQGKTTGISKYFSSPNAAKCFDGVEEDDKPVEISTRLVAHLKTSPLPNLSTGLSFDDEQNFPQCRKRTNLTDFIFNDRKIVDHLQRNSDDDFETPRKKVKCAPLTKKIKKSSSLKSRSNKQTNIKSTFLRNEQLFSEITAQHCIAENFNPDEVQLALAISRSEAEAKGILYEYKEDNANIFESKNDDEEKKENVEENIRKRLQKFGFRSADKMDYKVFTTHYLTGTKRKLCAKNKWKNKFTALTLHNPEFQLKKVNEKVKEFLRKQLKTKPLTASDKLLKDFLIANKTLRLLKAFKDNRIIKYEYELTSFKLENYFIAELFPVSYVKAGHLLKNWGAIPGRDLSPKHQSEQYRSLEEKMNNAYKDLKIHFQDVEKHPIVKILNEENLVIELKNEIMPEEKLIDAAMTKPTQNYKILDSFMKLIRKENATEKGEISEITQQSSQFENEEIQNIGITMNKNKLDFTQRSRVASPDLFADFDDYDVENVDYAIENTKPAEVIHSTADVSIGFIDMSKLNSSSESLNNNINKNMMTSPIEMKTNIKTLSKTFGSPIEPLRKEKKEIDSVNLIDDFKKPIKAIFIDQETEKTSTSNKKSVRKSMRSLFNSSKIFDVDNFWLNKKYQKKAVDCQLHSNCKKSISLTKLCDKNPIELQLKKSASFSHYVSNHNSPKAKSKNNSLSFESYKKSNSLYHIPKIFDSSIKESMVSIDLTQNNVYGDDDNVDGGDDVDDDNDDDNNGGVILSDDEINYSILKANITNPKTIVNIPIETHDLTLNSDSNDSVGNVTADKNNFETKKLNEDNFFFVDFIDKQMSSLEIVRKRKSLSFDNDLESLNNEFLVSPYKFNNSYSQLIKSRIVKKMADVFRERAEFGILDTYSEPYTQSPIKTPTRKIENLIEDIDSYVNYNLNDDVCKDLSICTISPIESTKPMKRYSNNRNRKKFNDLLRVISSNSDSIGYEDEADADFDEFDRLVYGSPRPKFVTNNVPRDLDKLLTAEISFQKTTPIATINIKGTQKDKHQENEQQLSTDSDVSLQTFESNGKIYTVQSIRLPKPEFTQQTEVEILKQLYNFGLKPLKRKQAIKILEHIYNQMHPLVSQSQVLAKTEIKNKKETQIIQSDKFSENDELSHLKSTNHNKLELKDCSGIQMLRYKDAITPELLGDEKFIFQTNINKKVMQPIVPFHIAWYNLVCANKNLHETILMYEPIDLQEIYLFLKSLGYRYNPKDMKAFLDRRCIIFRYELVPPDKRNQVNTNRHVRKNNKITSKSRRRKEVL